jgi:hypothetical protein
MRIPSQFNEDSLYRRGSRRNESTQTYHRLIRLVIGLALVVVVMGQAGKPAVYQTFFGPQASQPAGMDPSPQADPSLHTDQALQVGDPLAVPIAPEDRHIALLLTKELSATEQRPWVVALSRWQSGRRVDVLPSTAGSVSDRLQSLENIRDEQRRSWEQMVDSLRRSSAIETDAPLKPTSQDRPLVAAFLSALDDAAASRVVDGSVWRSGDYDALYRYLDQADSLSGAGVVATGVLPLLQQPDVFRNQLVRAHGGVARAERIEATENAYGITEYWQLWLRPSDGADRPLVAIVPVVSSTVAEVGADATIQEGPQVTIVGRFLKRFAYTSAMGADLAPVVVGRIASVPVTESTISKRIDADDSVEGNLGFTMTVACLIGFALAAAAMWRTSAMTKRARELRVAHRKGPDDFLRGLETSPDRVESRHPSTHRGE